VLAISEVIPMQRMAYVVIAAVLLIGIAAASASAYSFYSLGFSGRNGSVTITFGNSHPYYYPTATTGRGTTTRGATRTGSTTRRGVTTIGSTTRREATTTATGTVAATTGAAADPGGTAGSVTTTTSAQPQPAPFSEGAGHCTVAMSWEIS